MIHEQKCLRDGSSLFPFLNHISASLISSSVSSFSRSKNFGAENSYFSSTKKPTASTLSESINLSLPPPPAPLSLSYTHTIIYLTNSIGCVASLGVGRKWQVFKCNGRNSLNWKDTHLCNGRKISFFVENTCKYLFFSFLFIIKDVRVICISYWVHILK